MSLPGMGSKASLALDCLAPFFRRIRARGERSRPPGSLLPASLASRWLSTNALRQCTRATRSRGRKYRKARLIDYLRARLNNYRNKLEGPQLSEGTAIVSRTQDCKSSWMTPYNGSSSKLHR